eukprot:3651358-Rhodomonas_salina.1
MVDVQRALWRSGGDVGEGKARDLPSRAGSKGLQKVVGREGTDVLGAGSKTGATLGGCSGLREFRRWTQDGGSSEELGAVAALPSFGLGLLTALTLGLA